MKEYFVLADTHGFYKEMRAALKRNGFLATNPDHIIILCGDMLDRGEEAKKCINFFYKLHKKGRLIFVRGNHEDLFIEMVNRGWPMSHDYHNGSTDTYAQLYIPKNKDDHYVIGQVMKFEDIDPRWKELIDSSIDYYETKKYVFVHGWYPIYLEHKAWNSSKRAWYDARWDNGMEMASDGHILKNKTVVCGHWHTSWGNARKLYPGLSHYRTLEFDDEQTPVRKLMGIYRDKGIIAMDACTAWSGFCNCLKLTEDEI